MPALARPKATVVQGHKYGFPVRVALQPEDIERAQREADANPHGRVASVRRTAGGATYDVPVRPRRTVVARPQYDVVRLDPSTGLKEPMRRDPTLGASPVRGFEAPPMLARSRSVASPAVPPVASGSGLPFDPVTGEPRPMASSDPVPAAVPSAPAASAPQETPATAAIPFRPAPVARPMARPVAAVGSRPGPMIGAESPDLAGFRPGQVVASGPADSIASLDAAGASRAFDRLRSDATDTRQRVASANVSRIMKPEWDAYRERTSPEATAAALARMRQNWSASQPLPSRAERIATIQTQGMAEAERARGEGRVAVARAESEGATARQTSADEAAGKRQADLLASREREAAAQREFDAAQAEAERASAENRLTAELQNRLDVAKTQLDAARSDAQAKAEADSAERVAGRREQATDRAAPTVARAHNAWSTAMAEADKLKGGKRDSAIKSAVLAFADASGIPAADATVLLLDPEMQGATAQDMAAIVGMMRAEGINARDAIMRLQDLQNG